MEAYVDDMLIKSEKVTDHVIHLEETFDILRRASMKLNPKKCVFGISVEKFLGFMVNHHGIEEN